VQSKERTLDGGCIGAYLLESGHVLLLLYQVSFSTFRCAPVSYEEGREEEEGKRYDDMISNEE
jgi:hypothetical protein